METDCSSDIAEVLVSESVQPLNRFIVTFVSETTFVVILEYFTVPISVYEFALFFVAEMGNAKKSVAMPVDSSLSVFRHLVSGIENVRRVGWLMELWMVKGFLKAAQDR